MTIEKSAVFIMQVVSVPDFNLVLPSPSGIAYAGQVFPILVSLESVDQFAGDIALSISGQPAGSVVNYLPSNKVTIAPDSPGSIQINIAIPPDNALVGIYTILILATSTAYNGQ